VIAEELAKKLKKSKNIKEIRVIGPYVNFFINKDILGEGTIYPVIKEHKKKGLIKSDKNGRYTLTTQGKKELKRHSKMCCQLFYDMDEIEKCAK